MNLVFDTSVLSALLGNDDHILRALVSQNYDQILIPLAVDAELRFGFAYGSKRAHNLSNYELFRKQFHLEVVFPNQNIAIIYADLAIWARKHGVALSQNDIWIAATTVHLGGVLATLDQDFQRLPQVRLAKLAPLA
jgi:predicted nucleic acid-binding protein